MKFLNILNDKEVILIIPNELNSYFFEIRKKYPSLNFKVFTINNLFKELRGNYLDDKVINLGYKYFPNLTYSSIKEVSELVFKSFKIPSSNDNNLIKFNEALMKEGLLTFNEDLKSLLLSKNIYFINFKDSTLVKSLINELGLSNYKFLELNEVIDYKKDVKYHSFFNIFDESIYALNTILNEVDNGKDTKDIKVILDKERFNFYINLLFEGIDVPFKFNNYYSLIDTKTFKFIYKYLDDNSVSLIDLLTKNKEVINDNDNFDLILELFKTFDIDNLNNRKMNVIDILSSRNRNDINAVNAINFDSSLTFSIEKDIYVLGLDNSFMPKTKKNNKVYSYDFKNKLGLDSLNEVNLINSKLEESFLLQENIKFISFHIKDNAGRYQASYYVKSLKMVEEENLDFLTMYSLGSMKVFYRNLLDKFNKNGEVNNNLLLLKKYFKNEVLHTFSSNFTPLTSSNFDENKEFSYSSLKKYHACPFSYFVNYILKDNYFEDTIFTKFGKLAHEILAHIYDDNFDFDNISNEEINKFEFTSKEKILLKRFLFEVKETSKKILEHKNKMSLKKAYSELDLKYAIDVNFNNGENVENKKIKIGGRLDRLIETQDDGLYVIDYKTGNEPFKKTDFLERNLSMQLPFYLYLIEKSDNPIVKDKSLNGAFIQPLLKNEGKFYNFFSPSDEDIESTYLNGFFIGNYDVLSKFDYSLIEKTNEEDSDLKSDFILKLKLNKPKGGKYSISKRSSTYLEDGDFIDYANVVENYIINLFYGINKGKFDIYPLQWKFNVTGVNSCQYCNFSDICMKPTRKDEDGD